MKISVWWKPTRRSQRGIWDAVGMLGGSMLSGKGAKNAAQSAANAQQQMQQQAIAQLMHQIHQQQAYLQSQAPTAQAFFGVPGQMKPPSFLAAGQGTGQFGGQMPQPPQPAGGGGNLSGLLAGLFSGASPQSQGRLQMPPAPTQPTQGGQ